MTRGTTPTYSFALPFSPDTLSQWCLSFAQRGVEKFSVDASQAVSGPDSIHVTLTQEQTLALEAGVDALVQLRAVVASTGEAIASEILTLEVSPVLHEGVIE